MASTLWAVAALFVAVAILSIAVAGSYTLVGFANKEYYGQSQSKQTQPQKETPRRN